MIAYIEDLKKHVGQEVTLRGWVYNKRVKGKIAFVMIRDGSGLAQCVAVKNEIGDEKFGLCDHVPQESSVIVTGTVRADERSPGGVEIGLKDIQVIAESAPNYPIQIQDVAPEVGFLMQNRHLWLRSRKQAALLRVRAEIIRAIRDFFD